MNFQFRTSEAINGLLQAFKRCAYGSTYIANIKTVIFLIAGKINYKVVHFYDGFLLQI